MILHRITTKSYVNDLSGIGAMLYGGRWNAKGIRMVYTSGSLSLAALEMIANLSSDKLRMNLYCIELEFPDHLKITSIDELPLNWNTYPHGSGTMKIGSEFVVKKGLCLKVPSALIASEHNYLLNPLHDDFGLIRVIDSRPLILDQRLVGKLS